MQKEHWYDANKLVMDTVRQRVEQERTFNGRNIHSRRCAMNILKSTSHHQRNLDSRIHPLARGKRLVLSTSLMALLCFVFSPAWAGDYDHAKALSSPIHLTGVSIQIGPGGISFRAWGSLLRLRLWTPASACPALCQTILETSKSSRISSPLCLTQTV